MGEAVLTMTTPDSGTCLVWNDTSRVLNRALIIRMSGSKALSVFGPAACSTTGFGTQVAKVRRPRRALVWCAGRGRGELHPRRILSGKCTSEGQMENGVDVLDGVVTRIPDERNRLTA